MTKLWNLLKIIVWLPWSICFNLRQLPLRQAIKLPILLYKPELTSLDGEIEIQGPVRTGMIRLGFPVVSIYPSGGFRYENRGKIIFQTGGGKNTFLGGNCAISVGKGATLTLGENFCATDGVKIVCFESVTFGRDCLAGWGTMVTDCDFHTMHTPTGPSKMTAPVEIGDNNWFAMHCLVLKGTRTPAKCVFAARSTANRDYTSCGEETLFAGSPAKATRKGYYRILD